MTYSILLVDDTAEHLGPLAAALGADYEVTGAPSADVALAAASLEPPDLIVVEENAAGGNGADWCRRLRAAPKAGAVPDAVAAVAPVVSATPPMTPSA